MFDKKIFGQVQKKEKPQVKSCKRTIKRDEHGRVVREEFIGCNTEQIKAFRDADEKEVQQS